MTLQEHHIEHIKTWQASGLTQGVYCQQHGLNVKTFSRWLKLAIGKNQLFCCNRLASNVRLDISRGSNRRA